MLKSSTGISKLTSNIAEVVSEHPEMAFTAGLGIIAAGVIISTVYASLTKVNPLSEDELTKYDLLLNAKEFHFSKSAIPEYWKLIDNKPGI